LAAERLQGKVAIITGGGGGIGSAAGSIFCKEGAKVALVDRDVETAQAAAEEIRRQVKGAQVEGFVADLGEECAATTVVAKILAAFGKLDVLVNNVGIRRYEPLADAPWEAWDAIVRVNLLSFVSMSRAALPALRASGRGSIINVSSTYAVYGRKGMGAYDATKAAVLSLDPDAGFRRERARGPCQRDLSGVHPDTFPRQSPRRRQGRRIDSALRHGAVGRTRRTCVSDAVAGFR
jgi:2-hydroxycyclohexanecarboxyl-CoA dehydrogenase